MIFFIAFFIAFAVVNAGYIVKTPADFGAARTKCFTETKLPENFIAEIKEYKYTDDPAVHKYMLCSSKELGVFDEKTGYNVDYLVEQFGMGKDKSEVRKLIEKCAGKNEQKTSVEEWAWRDYKCMIEGGLIKEFPKKI